MTDLEENGRSLNFLKKSRKFRKFRNVELLGDAEYSVFRVLILSLGLCIAK